MPFGLTNAPATFCTLTNQVFYEYFDQFVIVYLDDIVVYSKTLEEHKVHLKLVFDKLRQNQLYIRKEKCAFAQTCINFLGHVISYGQISMDSVKIKAIKEWKIPTSISDVRSFLGLAKYYRRFVEGFSRRAAPLTELLKKDHPWSWSNKCQMAFEDLKATMTRGPILGLVDVTKPFEIETDASDFALGGVLIQEGFIAYESRKLNDVEWRYLSPKKNVGCGPLPTSLETVSLGITVHSEDE